MTLTYTVQPQDDCFVVCAGGKTLQTPARRVLAVPSKKLAEEIAAEWQKQQKYNASAMKLTSLAYTAIDRIAGQKEAIVEALLVYVDTDTLSYRAEAGEKLHGRQAKEWDPIIDWAAEKFSGRLQTTVGIMPIDQSPQMHAALRAYMQNLTDMQLAGLSVLASILSSLLLAIAVVEGRLDALKAFHLSRLEEDSQAEIWGRDTETEQRAQRLQEEILTTGRFLRLIEGL